MVTTIEIYSDNDWTLELEGRLGGTAPLLTSGEVLCHRDVLTQIQKIQPERMPRASRILLQQLTSFQMSFTMDGLKSPVLHSRNPP